MFNSSCKINTENNVENWMISKSLFIRNWFFPLLFVVLLIIIKKSTLKYYTSYLILWAMLAIASVVCFPICFLRPRHPENILWGHPIGCLTLKILGISCEIRGEELLTTNKPCVLLLNHQSILDTVVITFLLKKLKRVICVSKRELLLILPYAITMSLSGSVFIDRHNPKRATEILNALPTTLSKLKAKLLVFPEGTRNFNSEKLKPFKKGSFRVAIKGNIPIVPLIFSPYYFIDSNRKKFRNGHIIIKALNPIETNELTMDDLDSLIEKTWNIMNEEYKKIRSEVLKME